MPDYTSILKRSIEGVPDQTAEMRRAIYERARATITRQLTAVDPPLPAEQIEAQHQKLEQAIGEIEAEYAFENFDTAEFETEIGLREAEKTGAQLDFSDDEDDGRGYNQAEASIDYGTPASRRPTVDIRPSRAPMMVMLALLLLVGLSASVLGYRYQDQVVAFVEELTAPADNLMAQNQDGGDAGTQTLAAASDQDAGDPASTKDEARLGSAMTEVDDLRGSEPGETIIRQMDNGGSTQTAAVSDLPQQPMPPIQGAPGHSDQPADTLGSEPVVTGAAGPPGADTGSDRVGITSQKAIFYTQGDDDNPGQAAQGSVVWSRIEQPDGLPAIQAKIGLLEPKIDVIIIISKNTDEGLPASHLIEVTFDGVDNISDNKIERIPALVMKPSEQARGQPLIGAGVPVTESIFWIALSDEADQVTTNVATLRDGTWFDMPLLFKDNQRALITFEKGGAGDAVFKDVLSAWGPS